MNRLINSSRTRVLPYNQILKSIAVHYELRDRNIQLANSANKTKAENVTLWMKRYILGITRK